MARFNDIFTNKKNKGFTLVELIVVLVVLAILAAILIPSLLGFIDKAKAENVILDARYAYLDSQVALTQFYGQDAELYKAYYNSRTTSGYQDEDLNKRVRSCVITHQTCSTIQTHYARGGEQAVLDLIESYRDKPFSYGAHKVAYLVLKQMDALDKKNGKFVFSSANRASDITVDDFEANNNVKNCNPTFFQLYFDERGRVLMVEYAKDGYLVRYKNGEATVEKNGKTYKSYS